MYLLYSQGWTNCCKLHSPLTPPSPFTRPLAHRIKWVSLHKRVNGDPFGPGFGLKGGGEWVKMAIPYIPEATGTSDPQVKGGLWGQALRLQIPCMHFQHSPFRSIWKAILGDSGETSIKAAVSHPFHSLPLRSSCQGVAKEEAEYGWETDAMMLVSVAVALSPALSASSFPGGPGGKRLKGLRKGCNID